MANIVVCTQDYCLFIKSIIKYESYEFPIEKNMFLCVIPNWSRESFTYVILHGKFYWQHVGVQRISFLLVIFFLSYYMKWNLMRAWGKMKPKRLHRNFFDKIHNSTLWVSFYESQEWINNKQQLKSNIQRCSRLISTIILTLQ